MTFVYLILLLSVNHGISSQGSIEIISPQSLSDKLREKGARVSVIDARESGFKEGHIPSSQTMDWKEFTEESPGVMNRVLGSPEKWGLVLTTHRNGVSIEERLRKLGLTNDHLIVIVGDPNAWGEDGRIAWNLLYWGAKRVALLDGGFPAWKKSGSPVEEGDPKRISPGEFKVTLSPLRRVSKEEVKKNLALRDRPVFDIRTLDEFEGKSMPGQKRGGRIPGSKLIPLKTLYQANGDFISSGELRKLVGKEIENRPITYCTGGVRSALFAVLVEARLGILISSYDASIWEWSADKNLPIVTGPLK